MNQVTLNLSVNGNEYGYAPQTARVVITEQDVKRWRSRQEYLTLTDATCVEEMDFRCEFFTDDEHDDFRQDASRVAIFKTYGVFTGYEKHGGDASEWSTEPFDLDQVEAKMKESAQ